MEPQNQVIKTPEETPKLSPLSGLARDLGLGPDFIKDVGKDLVKGYVKEQLGIATKTADTKSKFGRTMAILKSMWWVPAAVYLSLMLGVLMIKFLSRMMGI